MSIKNKLYVYTALSALGIGAILLTIIFGLNAIGAANEDAMRRESYVVDLVEIKASALSSIMLDPALQETKDVFADAEKNIASHGEQALRAMKRETLRTELKNILQQWNNYDQTSQGIIKLAASNLKSANDQLVPVYNRDFKPFQAVLEKFVADRQADAALAKAESETMSRRIYTIVVAVTVTILLVIVLFVLALSRSIRARLDAMREKLILLKQGDLTQRLPDQNKDELGEIARDVNSFIDELQKIVLRTRDRSNLLSSAALQLATASAHVSSGSREQSEATSSIAAAVEQLSVSIDQVAEGASAAENTATLSNDAARVGSQEVQNAVDEIRHIEQVVNDASNQIEALGKRAIEISSIVNAIKEVADQTNLLALNAAIEAARAGEQGRGFAVVADEVRKLAERTTKSAQEITVMIGSIQVEAEHSTQVMRKGNDLVSQGVKKAELAGDSMQQINQSSSGVIGAISDISAALGEQKIASSEIANNIERIAHMTEVSTTAVAEVSASAKSLELLANELQQEVARFQV